MVAAVEPVPIEVISGLASERLLHDLVAIPSPSGEEAEAARFLVSWMGKHGFESYVDESGSAVGIRGEGEDEIVLLGHIDTVPGEIPLRFDGRKLYGRGTVDAKGALAAFAVAAATVKPPQGKRIVVIGATQEEAVTSLGAHHALERFNPSVCLIGEPSGWDRITLGYKGQLILDWSFCTPVTHSASPVPTSAERAVGFWLQVQQYVRSENAGRNGVFDRLDVSLRELNTYRVGEFDRAEMRLGFRLPPGADPYQLETRLLEMVDGADVRFMAHEFAFVAKKNTPLARAMLRSVRSCDGRPRFVFKTGTSDMNVVGPVWQCPIATYGPGDSRLDHTSEEHIDLDEFQRSVDVLRLALRDLLRNQRLKIGEGAGNE